MSNDIEQWRNQFFDLNPEAIIDDEDDKKKHKLDLFNTVLPAIDRKNKQFFSSLTEEEQNEIEPWILMRWLTSTQNDRDQPAALLNVNDFVNHNFSALVAKKNAGVQGHKELQWMLLTLCGNGTPIRRKFLKPGRGAVKNKLETALSELNPLMKNDELELLQKINTKEDFEEYFRSNGLDDKNIKELFK